MFPSGTPHCRRRLAYVSEIVPPKIFDLSGPHGHGEPACYRTDDALTAVEQGVLERLPDGSREENLTLTTDDGTQFSSLRFLEALGRLGITHRQTAYHHPEGNSYFERFHRSLKEEEVCTAEYRSLEETRASIARWIVESNHDRPHRGVGNRTPHEAFLAFAAVGKNGALSVERGGEHHNSFLNYWLQKG